MEGNSKTRLASESNPVEQGQDFATSTGTLEREEKSELSEISTENVATTRSLIDKTMMHGVTEKSATPSSFSKRAKNTLRNFFPFTMGSGTGDEAETQEQDEDDDEQDEFESQISPNSSTQENDAYTNRETGSKDRYGVVRTISKTANGSNQSGDFVTVTNSEVQPGKNRSTGPSNPPANPEAHYEELSRKRSNTRVSVSHLTSCGSLETAWNHPPFLSQYSVIHSR